MSIAMPAVQDKSGTEFRSNGQAPNGRLRVVGLSDKERNMAVAIHLSPYASLIVGPLAFLAPLVLWLVTKDKCEFGDDHGREMVNFMISVIVLALISICSVIGVLFLPVLAVIAVISPIRAAIAAGRGEYFRYPMTIRFL